MTSRKHYNVVAAVVEVDGKVLCMQRGKTRFYSIILREGQAPPLRQRKIIYFSLDKRMDLG